MKTQKEIEKLKKRGKTAEITKTILKICGMSGLAMIAGSGIRSPIKAIKLYEELGQYSAARIRECLKRLKMQDYIKYDESDLTRPIFLTQKGMKRFSSQNLIEKIKNFKMRKWDHIWRLVTFDVKEKKRWKRDNFRKCLQRLGFYKLQNNIYVLPFPVENEIGNLIKIYYMKNNALVLHVAELGDKEKEIKEYFLKLSGDKRSFPKKSSI